MAPYEALYGHKCRTPLCWYENGVALILGLELVQQRSLEFQDGEHIFLKVTPTTGVGWIIKSRKLTPRVIGPCQILTNNTLPFCSSKVTRLQKSN